MKLDGKVAFVTGSAGGIGKMIAAVFAAEGACVAVCDIDVKGTDATVGEITAAGGRAIAVYSDVSSKRDVDRAIREATANFGRINILVNCAGISEIRPFLELTEKQWDRTIRINLKSMFLTSHAVLPEMVQHKEGVIINISSQSGKRGASWYADYCASKFAIIGLTQSLAREFARDGIRVNAICPGVITTGMWNDAMWTGYARKRNLDVDKVRDVMLKEIPLGRFGTPDDVARLAVFLAGDDSAYMTGQAINLTGGSLIG